MFESYIADVIASTLGRYLDVQRDQLRISLWSGERASIAEHMVCCFLALHHLTLGDPGAHAGQGVLENVKLRPEALDHLQLPIKIRHGSVGKLKLQASRVQAANTLMHTHTDVPTLSARKMDHVQALNTCFLACMASTWPYGYHLKAHAQHRTPGCPSRPASPSLQHQA